MVAEQRILRFPLRPRANRILLLRSLEQTAEMGPVDDGPKHFGRDDLSHGAGMAIPTD